MGAMLIIGMGGKPKKGNTHMNPMESFLGGGDKGGDKGHLVEDEASSTESGKISFNKPAGFKIPDGVKDGESFDAMATVKMVNGKLVLSELDGTPVDDENEPEGEMEEETPAEESAETPEKEASEDESSEEKPSDESEEEPSGFLDAIEKKSKKFGK
jgi:hypothetical protein